MAQTADFWNRLYAEREMAIAPADAPVMRAALTHFGDVREKRVLDLGCGAGEYALAFAAQGAQVVALDQSEVAIEKLRLFARVQGIDNLETVAGSAMDLAAWGPFDFVFGALILHHLEPFATFVDALATALAPDGKAFFHENNAGIGSSALWFRQHLAGKLWFPKHGDADEFPLTRGEVDELRRHFTAEVTYPELALFRLVSYYVFRNRMLPTAFAWLDETLYHVPAVRPLSYYQYLALSRNSA